jgi:hypothetical protein
MQFPTGAKEKIDDVDNGVLLLQRARGRFFILARRAAWPRES